MSSFSRRVIGVGSAAALLALMLVIPAATASQSQLAEVRAATAQFHQVENAIEAGYELGYQGIITGCIAHPTAGAMGYHYFNEDLFADPAADPLQPEGLLYVPGPNGKLKLVAVEWVVPKSVWEGAGNTGAPSVLGIEMHILNPVLNWYIQHAWIWDVNPAGIYEDWNPDIECPAS